MVSFFFFLKWVWRLINEKKKKKKLLAFENDPFKKPRTVSCQCASFRQAWSFSELEGGFKITHSDTASKLKWVDKCSIYLNFGFEHFGIKRSVSISCGLTECWVNMRAQHSVRNTEGTGLGNRTDATVSADPTSAAPKPRSGELLLMQLCPVKK